MINPDLKNVIKGWDRNSIASKIANDLPHASYVNLGIGMPELVSQHIKEDREIIYHSENGLLGMGPTPNENEIDLDLINAGKKPVTILPGGSFCHHADSFSMIRGGHIDYCVLGAMEVSINGDLANWSTGKGIPAVGGAMDLVAGAKNVFVMTQHITKEGKPKLVQTCTLPLTGAGVVSRVYSDYAVIDITKEGFKVIDINQNISMEFLQNITDGKVYQ
ncbi:MAG: 3-oxoacid CoA-transferase subunit B [Alphaproteobacteria bacterium]|jgi:3-oxoadipate CoA-transferase beta subunit|uniref:3-oxoacid CoA-transferase subunit B n=1 Tax=Candidatus Levibacter sp. Uisw_134_01 TaxID=3230999 RepID=UPI001D96839E|nr:3-oxoacid CoA-transferase subunit B [Alphaproteobacteria bacterium]MDA7546728.1 3-oxoacid CoA-transferase subunit B [Alphaproteobacteria bacterium]MDA9649133.1 3-oxoacid CoA-transferase subunit B [Alphaproteobacteria bacterium]MDA9674484.1 3-oxoacid CoA-transferase subunit B [Alphaproteobacteria bacterium]MDC0092912.1 3-oxoacid CoA-transferase subunit B [Alphaproteobacteria bacterium]|tara:strand:+ start:1162 stop:1818 length:657 start_codon:yes stop_codon:yes gene_type:complete